MATKADFFRPLESIGLKKNADTYFVLFGAIVWQDARYISFYPPRLEKKVLEKALSAGIGRDTGKIRYLFNVFFFFFFSH